MPGLFGVCSGQVTDDVVAIAHRMKESIRHHAWYTTRMYVEPASPFAGGRTTAIHRSHTEAERSTGAPVIFVDGEIYDQSIHKRELSARGRVFAGDGPEELLAHGIAEWGEAFLERLEGYFSAVVWHPEQQLLLLVNDRFGMKPFYYAHTAGALVFSSEIKAILQHPAVTRDRHLKGVAQFFTYGHMLGNDTLFSGVRTVPPASVMTYDARSDTLTSRRYWSLRPGSPIATQREALSTIDACFERAVERRTQGQGVLGLSLSGGLDARTILAAIPRNGTAVKCVSLGIPGSIDHRAAAKLAALAGASHHPHYLQRDFLDHFPDYLQRLVFLTDGHYLDQAITVPTLQVYRDLGIEVLLRGHAGELLHMNKAYSFSIRRDELGFSTVADLEQWLWSHLTAYMIAGVGHDMFRAPLRSEVASLARESLRDALLESEGFEPPGQRMWHLFVVQRLRRETAMSMQMFNSVVDVRLPYLDTDLVEAIMRIPPELKMGDALQAFILRRHLPAFLKVINANTGAPLEAGRVQRAIATFQLRLFSKLGVPGYQPYERLGLWLSHELQPLLRELLLSERALDRGLLDPDVVRRLIDEHATRRRNHTFMLMTMLIFEYGQRQFVDLGSTLNQSA